MTKISKKYNQTAKKSDRQKNPDLEKFPWRFIEKNFDHNQKLVGKALEPLSSGSRRSCSSLDITSQT